LKVGFIGLGNMGEPMARNVRKAGFELIVWNRTRSRGEGLIREGARAADSPAILAQEADLILACLADIPASLEVFLGREGIVPAARKGQVLVDHSTVDLETSRRIHDAAAERGAAFLDAPVSGGPRGAAEGTLSIMAGGDAAAFERALPVFRSMGKTVLHMGGCGAGTVTKLVNQLLVGVHTLAACEALALARKAGADLRKVIEVLGNSWGQSRMLERNAPPILGRDFGPSSVPLRNLLKDLEIIVRLGKDLGLTLPAASRAREAYETLAREGKERWDISAASLLVEGK
jgi:3-hydroxyisobutyrate dehydrogenase-like beta-hydroxyacid dehydrogenase